MLNQALVYVARLYGTRYLRRAKCWKVMLGFQCKL
nr:MAG TPA: hypothetical protein [Caudoviricetes sp.]